MPAAASENTPRKFARMDVANRRCSEWRAAESRNAANRKKQRHACLGRNEEASEGATDAVFRKEAPAPAQFAANRLRNRQVEDMPLGAAHRLTGPPRRCGSAGMGRRFPLRPQGCEGTAPARCPGCARLPRQPRLGPMRRASRCSSTRCGSMEVFGRHHSGQGIAERIATPMGAQRSCHADGTATAGPAAMPAPIRIGPGAETEAPAYDRISACIRPITA